MGDEFILKDKEDKTFKFKIPKLSTIVTVISLCAALGTGIGWFTDSVAKNKDIKLLKEENIGLIDKVSKLETKLDKLTDNVNENNKQVAEAIGKVTTVLELMQSR